MAIPRKKVDRRLLFQWTGTFEKYSRKWVNNHFWRVQRTVGDRDDALQVCALVHSRVVAKYADTVNNPAWMMSLFKISLVNEWNSLSKRDGEFRQVHADGLLWIDDDNEEYQVPELTDSNLGPMLAGWSSLSSEAQMVVRMILEAPNDILELIGAGGDPIRINRRLRRLCAIQKQVDIVAELRNRLS